MTPSTLPLGTLGDAVRRPASALLVHRPLRLVPELGELSAAGARIGLAPVPEGQVNLRMLRRTLSSEMAYRPGRNCDVKTLARESGRLLRQPSPTPTCAPSSEATANSSRKPGSSATSRSRPHSTATRTLPAIEAAGPTRRSRTPAPSALPKSDTEDVRGRAKVAAGGRVEVGLSHFS